jgi:CMP-N,N'-diacetyllegionaminic acid synthase
LRNSSRYLGLIPARGGSKGIPRKNLAPLGDRPLVQYTIEAARDSRRLDRVVLSSDDAEIIALARSLGVEAPFTRPAELATDAARSVDVVLHALDWLAHQEAYVPDAVVLLQPTCPFRDGHDVDAAIAAYETAGGETLLSVSPVLQHPCEMVRVRDGRPEPAVPHPAPGAGRHALPAFYFIDGAIYIATPGFLRGRRQFHDDTSAVHVIERSHGFDIDDPEQLELARALLLLRSAATPAGRGSA